jgi:hypothetical protein
LIKLKTIYSADVFFTEFTQQISCKCRELRKIKRVENRYLTLGTDRASLVQKLKIQRGRGCRQVISGEVAVGFALAIGAGFACFADLADSGARSALMSTLSSVSASPNILPKLVKPQPAQAPTGWGSATF